MRQAPDNSTVPPKPAAPSRSKVRVRTSGRSERFYARLTTQQKAVLQRAATLQHRSLSDFIVSIATQRAEEVIREQEIIALSLENSRFFADLMINPPEPNEALVRAAKQNADLFAD